MVNFLLNPLFGKAIFFLEQTCQLLAFAIDSAQIVVGQLAPTLLGFTTPVLLAQVSASLNG